MESTGKRFLWFVAGLGMVGSLLPSYLLNRNIRPHNVVSLSSSFRIPWDVYDWRPVAATSDDGPTMRAASYDTAGTAATVRIDDCYPQPQLTRPSMILVRVHYSSLNPCDFKFRRNALLPHPLLPKPKIPGADVAGVVAAVWEDDHSSEALVHDFRVGDRVAVMLPLLGARWGSAADYVAVEARWVARVGRHTSLRVAAAVPLVGLTVVQALEGVRDSSKETHLPQSILIHAGAGGVGSFAISYAKHVLEIPTVIATASSPKHATLQGLGCDKVIDYRTTNFEEALKETQVDIVLDPMSWNYAGRSLRVLQQSRKFEHLQSENGQKAEISPPGSFRPLYINILSSAWSWEGWEELNVLHILWHWSRLQLQWLWFGGGWNGGDNLFMSPTPLYRLVAVEPNGKQLQHILDAVDRQKIVPLIDRVYPLDKIQQAFEYLEQGHATGKVLLQHVVEPGPSP